MWPTNAGSPSGQTVLTRSTDWPRLSSGLEAGMWKAPGIMKDLAITLSFLKIPAAIVWKSAIEP